MPYPKTNPAHRLTFPVIPLEMKLSEHPEYRIAVQAAMESDFDSARSAYLHLISVAANVNDDSALSYLLQCLADVEARSGNLGLGLQLHQRAIDESPNIPFVLIFFAKSLAKYFDQKQKATDILIYAETLLNSQEWIDSDDNISVESYITQIQSARVEIAG